MINAQIKQLRADINAAHACGDMKKAEKLQAKLHRHFEQQSDEFMSSAAGAAHMDALVNKFD